MKKLKNGLKSIRLHKLGKRSLLIGLLVLATTAGLALFFVLHKQDRSNDDGNQRIYQVVDKLSKEAITCEQVIDELGDISTDQKGVDKKKILELRLECYAKLEKYDEAITVAESLKTIHTEEGATDDARIIDMTINNLKTSKETPRDRP